MDTSLDLFSKRKKKRKKSKIDVSQAARDALAFEFRFCLKVWKQIQTLKFNIRNTRKRCEICSNKAVTSFWCL